MYLKQGLQMEKMLYLKVEENKMKKYLPKIGGYFSLHKNLKWERKVYE
jgi:hypothetical protein